MWYLAIFLVSVAFASPFSAEYFDNLEVSGEFDGRWDEAGDSYELLPLAAPSGWQSKAFDYVNELRARAGVSPLKYDDQLAAGSQKWADKLACKDRHYHDSGVTENLAGLYTDLGEDKMAIKGVQSWYNEYKVYTCGPVTSEADPDGSYYKSVGHYMNLMRKDYDFIGFGMAVCPTNSKKGILVARFKSDAHWDMWNEQLKKQGLPKCNTAGMDANGLTPCPKDFQVE